MINTMRPMFNKFLKGTGCVMALAGALTFQSCKEQIDTSARYVFSEETISSYLEKHPEDYSEYFALLGQVNISPVSASTVLQLMSARGNFTCFAPTNQAIHDYLDSLVARGLISEPRWEAFTDSTIKDSIRQVIVYNSIIDGGGVDSNGDRTYYETNNFPQNNNEEFSSPTLSDRKLSVYRSENDPDSIFINGNVAVSIRNRDIPAINGVIHQVEQVIAPSNNTLGYLMKSWIDEEKEGYLVYAKMLQACGLFDTLSKSRDEVYEMKYKRNELKDLRNHPSFRSLPGYLPEHRKYGYTLFAEPDSFWTAVIGKPYNEITLEDVKNKVVEWGSYPEAKTDDDYTNPDNVLYQFVTYHLLPCRIPADKLIIHYNEKGYSLTTKTPTVAMTELYTTMGQRRLLKIFESRESNGIYLNRFPVLKNGRHDNYHEVSCEDDKAGFRVDVDHANTDLMNAIIYPICHEALPGKALVYDQDQRENLQRQRLRFDVAGLFPEFMNNDIRGQTVTTDRNLCVGIPVTSQYQYLDDLEMTDQTDFYYLLGRGLGWTNYQADEFNIVGRYEYIMRLPPVPTKGTYELRVAIQSNSGVRGMCQVYWGTDKDRLPAQGIPLDMRMGGLFRYTTAGTFPSTVGWEADNEEDDDINSEIDKKMRNNDFMKGPEHYIAGSPGGSTTARASYNTLRRIMVRATMDPDQVYYIKFKSVLDDINKEFYMDYIELCSKEVYDNPETPEDIW